MTTPIAVEACIPKRSPAWRYIRIVAPHSVSRQQMREIVLALAEKIGLPRARASVRTRTGAWVGYVRVYAGVPTVSDKKLWRRACKFALMLELP